MFRTQAVPGGVEGPPLPPADLRRAILRCAQQLHLVASLAESTVSTDELDLAVDHLVTGVAELQGRLGALRAAVPPQ
jgi:hypothetical protein